MKAEANKTRGSFRASDLAMPDYHDIVNAIVEGPSTASVVSFDIEWFDILQRVTVDSSNNRGFGGSDWGGKFAVTNATAAWSSHQPGFHFTSDPASTSQPVFAFIGEERNGVFFP